MAAQHRQKRTRTAPSIGSGSNAHAPHALTTCAHVFVVHDFTRAPDSIYLYIFGTTIRNSALRVLRVPTRAPQAPPRCTSISWHPQTTKTSSRHMNVSWPIEREPSPFLKNLRPSMGSGSLELIEKEEEEEERE